MKFKFILILVLIFAVAMPACTAYGLKIDASNLDYEWADADNVVLLKEKDSNKVNFGSVSYIVDKNGFDVYLMIYFSDSSSENYDRSGIIITLNGVVFTVDVNGNVTNPDNNAYLISSAVSVVDNDGFYCEMKIGFKHGLSDKISAKICFIDGQGTHSYHYPFVINNKYAVTTKAKTTVVAPKPEKTSKERTTVHKTTKPKATKPITTKVVNALTQSETIKTTKRSTAKNTANNTVVYYFEKEVVVSEVYVSADSYSSVETVCNVNPENVVYQNVIAENANAERFNEGVKIFRAVCVVAGVILGVFAVWAGLNRKKTETQPNNANNKDVTDEDNGEQNK